MDVNCGFLCDRRNISEKLNTQEPVTFSDLRMNNPPSVSDLDKFMEYPPSMLPPKYRRSPDQRIFVCRELDMAKVKFVGFDMDYTLAEYNSPAMEELEYRLTAENLVKSGYPKEILELKYDSTFAMRGLFMDKKLGNLVKVDSAGSILRASHGRTSLTRAEIEEMYPTMILHSEEIGPRFYLLDTLFALPEACLWADLVTYFESKNTIGVDDSTPPASPSAAGSGNLSRATSFSGTSSGADGTEGRSTPISSDARGGADSLGQHGTGANPKAAASADTMEISYFNLFTDVRRAYDGIHQNGSLKNTIMADMATYIAPAPELGKLLSRMRASGIFVFLLTNSGWNYSNKVMNYLLGPQCDAEHPTWPHFFNLSVVSSRKPSFFAAGTSLREVDTETGNLKIMKVKAIKPGAVYAGGSIEKFYKLTGGRGDQVLYVGDHIFGDIIKSKKVHGWRNLLIIPELAREISIFAECTSKFAYLKNLEYLRAELYRGLDSSSTNPPECADLVARIQKVRQELDDAANENFGSLFRSGSQTSFFSSQVKRFADLYTSSYVNLLHYPFFYQFMGSEGALAHEKEFSVVTGDRRLLGSSSSKSSLASRDQESVL